MTKNTIVFLIFFVLTFLSGLGVNVFEKNLRDFLFWRTMPAQVNQSAFEEILRAAKPLRLKSVSDPEFGAQSVASILLRYDGQEKVLFKKAERERLPIASLTKLMTAKIVLESYNPTLLVTISEKATTLPGNGAQKLNAGQVFRVLDLLYPILMESNNTATYALSEVAGQGRFLELMNLEAENLGMEETQFLNPTGLDESGQYSSAFDLVKLTKNLLQEQSFIWNILSLPEANLYSAQGQFVYTVNSTNELLNKIPSIIGGKTGETPKAGGCLLLVTEAPKGQGYLINIVLNSEDRFWEMEKLINWVHEAYFW